MSGKKVLVTGGAGFIGSHVADALIDAGHDVSIIDDLSSGKRDYVSDKAKLFVMDIRSEEAARAVEEIRPEVIYHLAAQMDVRKSVYDPSFDADVNIRGPLNLLEAGRKVGLKKVVFSSTGGAIYGEQNVYPAGEDHPEWPLSPYGITKLALEKYLFYYFDAYGISTTCLRYANVYGPRQNAHGEAGVIAIFSRRLIAGEQPAIFGDGENTRDFVYVGDVVRANMAALEKSGYEIYNVGTGIESTVNEIFAALKRIIDVNINAIYEEARPGEQRRSSIRATKIKQELGIDINTTIENGFEKTVNWFKDNK